MIKRWMRIVVLVAAFFFAVIISFRFINHEATDTMLVFADPTLPRVYFYVVGQRVNNLAGYVDEMELTAMRDTITPLEMNGILNMGLETNGNLINSVYYSLFSLDGEEVYATGQGNQTEEGTIQFHLLDGLDESSIGEEEAILKITLQTDSRDIYYYTRVILSENFNIRQCFNFARNFQEMAFAGSNAEQLGRFLESGVSSHNDGLRRVTLSSTIDELQWGVMHPQLHSEIEWSIYETNAVYTSVLARYFVTSTAVNGRETLFSVREFFRVRYAEGQMYMQFYDRTVHQMYDGHMDSFDAQGIYLGMGEELMAYEVNQKANIVAFVRERDLWVFHQELNALALVFSFSEGQRGESRSTRDQHEVRILQVEDNGNVAFAVYGYMNRGAQEGRVGVAVYYYNMEMNVVEEIAFIPSNRPFGITELGQMVHYNPKLRLLSVITGGNFYQVDLYTGVQTILASDLDTEEYVVSEDGRLFAWQYQTDADTASTIVLKNLQTGIRHSIVAPAGEMVRPLGFINDDLVYGFLRPTNVGQNHLGESITPMYKIEIRDIDGGIAKTYQLDNVFILDVEITANQVGLERLFLEENVYHEIERDSIIYNQELPDNRIMLEMVSADVIGQQARLTFVNGMEDISPRLLRPQKFIKDEVAFLSFAEAPREERFYVYALGRMVGVYDNAVDAIQIAERLFGVVVTTSQSCIWERGNRYLFWNTHIDLESFYMAEGQSAKDALENFMGGQNARRIDLGGANFFQILHVMNLGLPVIGITDENNAILFMEYTMDTITYFDPNTGTSITRGQFEMERIMREYGNGFVGFVR
ncbi:MAG: hypothetical protein FWE25_09650 [Lachnospiraceae bacterium]|nr:hypothetical protein [Lachnospiraceae bacterium]